MTPAGTVRFGTVSVCVTVPYTVYGWCLSMGSPLNGLKPCLTSLIYQVDTGASHSDGTHRIYKVAVKNRTNYGRKIELQTHRRYGILSFTVYSAPTHDSAEVEKSHQSHMPILHSAQQGRHKCHDQELERAATTLLNLLLSSRHEIKKVQVSPTTSHKGMIRKLEL